MKNLFIDVTQSYAWKGRVMGIIRVMDEISIRFMQDSSHDATFVAWDELSGTFFKLDYGAALEARQHTAEVSSDFAGSKIEKPHFVKQVALRVPLSRTVHKALKKSKSKTTVNRVTVEFEPGSILFMPHGGVWESDKYAAEILRLQASLGVKLAPILYDLCPVLTPQFCSEGIRIIFNKYMSKILPEADLILAISENTAQDARTWISSKKGTQLSTIKVFRLGDEIAAGQTEVPAGTKLPKYYILCVGTIEARKNHTSLYYAYKLAKQKGINLPPVIVVGRKGWLAEDIYEIIENDPDVDGKFIFLHDTSDGELNWLYAHALFSVYPSFYEGWGLPIAESLLRGVPCLSSNTSSMPEIAGTLIDYFSPYDPNEIMESIQALSSNKEKLAKKVKQIQSEFVPTQWDESYKQVEALITKI